MKPQPSANAPSSTITILGAGYVGLTSAALFANAGFKVFVVEPNPERLSIIQSGRSFFFEAGIDSLIKNGLKSGNLIATDSYELSVPQSEFIFSCVGTPDKEDGSSNLEFVYSAARSTAKLARPGAVFIQKSTVPVGAAKSIITIFNECNANIEYVSNPEFLREGSAVLDTLYFDRVVVGGESHSASKVIDIYKQLESQRDTIAERAGLEAGNKEGEYIQTSLASAELIKVTSNAFLALKISFANTIAKIADAADADIVEVMDAVGSDRRIGRAFLNAGRGYGGGCFPKDVSGLIASSAQIGVDFGILKEAQAVNESMPEYIINKTRSVAGEDFKGKKIAVLGLAFKPDTSDTRKSPGIKFANILNNAGANVHTYDPQAGSEARHDLHSDIVIADNINSAIQDAEIVFITTAWSDFQNIDFSPAKESFVLVDAVNMLDSNRYQAPIRFIGVGR